MTEKHLTGPKGFSGWRDTHARVIGDAALTLQTVFLTMWYNTTGQNLFEERYFPKLNDISATLPVQVVSAGPDSQWKAIQQSYMAMVMLARRHVYLQSPFLIPDDGLEEVMKAAALAGIKVVVMIAPRGGEGQLAYRAGMTYARDLAEAGVRVLLYQGAYFHAKTVCVDSSICCIGSANMDVRSFSINYETNLVVYDEAVTRELEDLSHRHAQLYRVLDSYIRRSACSNPPGRLDDAIVFATSLETSRCALKSQTMDDIRPSDCRSLLGCRLIFESSVTETSTPIVATRLRFVARAPGISGHSNRPPRVEGRDEVRMDGVR